MNQPVHCEECSAVHGVPTSHLSDSHMPGAVSGYNMRPMGIPTISHMNKDLSFTIVAAGHEQVAEYLKLKLSEEYHRFCKGDNHAHAVLGDS